MGRRVKRKHRNARIPSASSTAMNDLIKIGLKNSVEKDIVKFHIFILQDAFKNQEDSN